MDKERDFSCCDTCLNRIYGRNDDLKCLRKIDNSNVQFYCSEYASEDKYFEKTNYVDRNDKDYSHKKVLNFFLVLALLKTFQVLLALVISLNIDIIESEHVLIFLLFVIIDFLFYYFLYKCKPWARRIGILLFAASLIVNTVDLVLDNTFVNMLSVIYDVILLYFIKYNKNYINYFNSQNI